MPGRARYAYISATSNTVVSTTPGSLYSITGNFPSGTIVRIDDTHRFGQGVLDINAVSSNTIGAYGASTVFGQGLGYATGLAVAVSSNAKITIEYD